LCGLDGYQAIVPSSHCDIKPLCSGESNPWSLLKVKSSLTEGNLPANNLLTTLFQLLGDLLSGGVSINYYRLLSQL
jgi:hypothetical protein